MGKYITGLKIKLNEAEAEGLEKMTKISEIRLRKIVNLNIENMIQCTDYQDLHIRLCNGQERPLCLLRMNTFASDNMKPNKLKGHLEIAHPDHVDKTREFFKDSQRT